MARFNASFDGGSRGNPGLAAWGVAVFDDDGKCLERHAGTIGKATNNVAEYNGLLEALRLAVDRNAEEVRLRSDSELIVRQLEGRYRVKHPDLKPLFAEAKSAIAKFALFKIEHVRRGILVDGDRNLKRIAHACAAGVSGGAGHGDRAAG